MWSDRLSKYIKNGEIVELYDNGEFLMQFVDVEPCGFNFMSRASIELIKIDDDDSILVDREVFYYDDDFTDNFNKICDKFFEKYIKE